MKICSIGNSFSNDAHKWLHKLAKLNGFDIETANLYIGGCSLETHWKNAKENNAHYDFELNGNSGERKISIAEALELEKYDIVTLQQVSGLSGIYETYDRICPRWRQLSETHSRMQNYTSIKHGLMKRTPLIATL